jgi:hypothetical protein
MKLSAVILFGIAAFVMANPVPEAEAEAGLVDSVAASLPHALTASDIMTNDKPVNLITRSPRTIHSTSLGDPQC